MSDTHGDADVIQRVSNYYPEIETLIHCGDSELQRSHYVLSEMSAIVRGNCDRDDEYPIESVLEIEGVKLYVTHGHLFNVKQTPLNLLYRAQEIGADIVFFGHSHIIAAEVIEDTLFVNPGSLLKPRGREEKSFAIVERDAQNWTVTFYTHENEKISSHTFPIPVK